MAVMQRTRDANLPRMPDIVHVYYDEFIPCTVKPVLRGHHENQEKVVF
jgi:hypothetical protein